MRVQVIAIFSHRKHCIDSVNIVIYNDGYTAHYAGVTLATGRCWVYDAHSCDDVITPAMALYCAYILLVLNGDIVADPNFRAAGFPFAIYAPNNLRPFVCDWPQYQQKLQTTRDSTQLKKTHAHRLSYTMFVLISVQLTWAMDTNTSVLKLHLHQSQNYDHWLYTNDVDGRTDDLPTIA